VLFRRDRVFILDFPTLADGRIGEFLQFGLIYGKFLLADPASFASKPQNEKNETVHLVRRAEDCVARLKKLRGIKVTLLKTLNDPKNINGLARRHRATVLTVDPDMKQTLSGISVIQLDELYEALKPAYLPGSEIIVKVMKKGKEANEGIGYLEGGVKVVIDGAARYVGKDVTAVVIGSLDTSVGRIIFAQPKYIEVK